MAYRNLTFTSLASDLRTEIYMGEEHLVIPCVALIGDEVVTGMLAEGPELIPAKELELSVPGWSGRPVLPDHPDPANWTANDPSILESMQFGQIFFPTFEDNKLKVEAWLSRSRAEKVGAIEIIERCENGEVIELSVGAVVSLEKSKGVAPNGKSYIAVWHDILGDHLAIGLNGSQGACSVDLGCGANRANRAINHDSDIRTMRSLRGDVMPKVNPVVNPTVEPLVTPTKSHIPTFRKILSSVFRSNIEDEGLSDQELRIKLWDILYSIEPAFVGIEDVYQDSKTVRYICNPVYPEAVTQMWRRTFQVVEGEVSVGDEREEVTFDIHYIYLAGGERVEMSDQVVGSDPKPCACQSQAAQSDNFPKEETMPEKKDEPVVPPNTDPAVTPPVTPPATTPPVEPIKEPDKPAADPPKPLTEDEEIEALKSESLRQMVKKYRAQETKEREQLIAQLGKRQKAFTVEELEGKPTEELEKLLQVMGGDDEQSDFSGRILVSGEEDDAPKEGVWSRAIKKQQERNRNQQAN